MVWSLLREVESQLAGLFRCACKKCQVPPIGKERRRREEGKGKKARRSDENPNLSLPRVSSPEAWKTSGEEGR